ncbi:MAG: T9SS type A sorting domain-containing protein [Ignavibacteria bacterium]|nr:T9SS type A sorting domain-containing protein [Ignavibacteria bacterium]
MKSTKHFFAIIYVFMVYVNTGYSDDTTLMNYLPLKTGNSFVYLYQYSAYLSNDTSYRFRVSIDRDSIISNKQYFYCNGSPWGTGWFRTDTLNKAIHKYDSANSCSLYYNNEILTDSFAVLPDGWFRCGYTIRSSTIFPSSIFGIQTQQLYVGVGFYTFIAIWKRYYAEFGLAEYVNNTRYTSYSYTLKGCVVNGNVYGDTSIPITGITYMNNEIPDIYDLSQNYPNPFNPQTKIKFELPSLSRSKSSIPVKLIIYDLLGREVATLVNEELKPGTYEADWDASNYSSGVYFYKIISEGFVETKKMVLMK